MEHERETTRDGAVFVMHDTVARYDSHAEASHTEHGLTYLMDGWLRMEHGGPVEAVAGTLFARAHPGLAARRPTHEG